jgi:hypothetical protein
MSTEVTKLRVIITSATGFAGEAVLFEYPIALQNQREVFGFLFRAAAETLRQIAADPKHLGAEIGFLAILNT